MINELKNLVKEAKTKQDALEVLHIEAQNMKIRLVNRGYKLITTPGEPGPSFEEELDPNQVILQEDKELVDYFKTIRSLKKAVDNFQLNHLSKSTENIQNEFITIIENKPS